MSLTLTTELTEREFKILVLTVGLDNENQLFRLYSEGLDDGWRTDEFHNELIELSKNHDSLFILHERDYEYAYEDGCESKTYYKNGKSKTYYPKTIWPEFKESDLE